MRTRHATPDDLDDLIGLVSALFAEDGGTRDPDTDVGWPQAHGRPYYAKRVRDPRSLVLLADTDQGVVGFVIGRLRDHDALRPGVVGAELVSMFVTTPWRSRGVGRTLASHFRRWASSHGATEAMVSAHARNVAALRFYRSLGYGDHQVVLHQPLLTSGG